MHFIDKQEIWLPTLQGWLLIITFIIGFILLLLTRIYSFLAVNAPIQANLLVLEGWIPDSTIKEAISEFEKGGYQKLITIGPRLVQGHYLSQYQNAAEVAAATLLALGFAPDKLVAVPTPEVARNRTYASAVALRKWIEDSNLNVDSLNLYTFDVHSRRNWLIFKQTFAPKIKVGVIVLEPLFYEPKHWWTASAGVKSVIFEAIAYIYARLINWKA